MFCFSTCGDVLNASASQGTLQTCYFSCLTGFTPGFALFSHCSTPAATFACSLPWISPNGLTQSCNSTEWPAQGVFQQSWTLWWALTNSREQGGFLRFCGGKCLTGGQSEPADNEVSVGEPSALRWWHLQVFTTSWVFNVLCHHNLKVTAEPAVLTVMCKSEKNIYICMRNWKNPVIFTES